MGRTLAQLRFDVSGWNPTPRERLAYDVYITDATLGESLLRYDVAIDASPAEAALGRPTLSGGVYSPVIQTCAMRVSIGGTDLDIDHYTAQVSVTETMDGTTWAIQIPYYSISTTAFKVPTIGEFFADMGTPPGKDSVDIYGVYQTSSGIFTYPLVTNGIVDNVSAQDDGSGVFLVINGVDASGRYDRQTVDYVLEPGHNTRREDVIAAILTQAGVPADEIAIGGTADTGYMNKELQLIESEWRQACQSLALVDNKKLRMGRDGKFVLTDIYPDAQDISDGPVWTIDDASYVPASLSMSGSGDVPTEITMRCSQTLGAESEYDYAQWSFVVSRANRAVQQATDTHSTAGAISSFPQNPTLDAKVRPVKAVVKMTFTRGDTVVREITVEFGLKKVQAYRYQIGGAATRNITAYNFGYVFDSGVVKDDEAPIYRYRHELLMPISLQDVSHSFDSNNNRTQTVKKTGGWMIRTDQLKTRTDTSTSWESTNFSAFITGSGVGVYDDLSANERGEQFYGWSTEIDDLMRPIMAAMKPYMKDEDGLYVGMLLPRRPVWPEIVTSNTSRAGGQSVSVETTEYDVVNGYVQSERVATQTWEHRPGGDFAKHLYHDGESRDSEDTFVESKVVEKVWSQVPGSDSRVTLIESVYNVDGELVSNEITEQDGSLPAASTLGTVSTTGSRTRSQQISFRAYSTSLAAKKVTNVPRPIDQPYAENHEDLERMAKFYLYDGSSIPVTFIIPCNFIIRVGQLIRVRGNPAGAGIGADTDNPLINNLAVVESVSNNQAPGDTALMTTISCKAFVIGDLA